MKNLLPCLTFFKEPANQSCLKKDSLKVCEYIYWTCKWVQNQAANQPNIWIYNLSFGPHISVFLAVAAKKLKKFRVNVCFETSEHSVKTADDSSNLTSKTL